MLLDTASWDRQLQTATVVSQAVLRSEAEPGARAFLAAPPSGKTRMEPAVFVTELRQRLGVADASTEAWCPRCDGVLDTLSLHAAVCCAGGERTVRHHALRDILATWVDRAGLQPEKEKGGLLLPEHPDDSSRKPWEKQRAPIWRPLLRMRKAKQPIWTLLQHVGGKGLNFSPGGRKYKRLAPKAAGFLHKISSPAAARERANGEGLHAALLHELWWLLERSGPKQFCADALSSPWQPHLPCSPLLCLRLHCHLRLLIAWADPELCIFPGQCYCDYIIAFFFTFIENDLFIVWILAISGNDIACGLWSAFFYGYLFGRIFS